MPTAAQLSVVIRGDTEDAEKKIGGINKQVKESGGFFKNALSNAMSFAAGGLIVEGVGKAVGFVRDNLTDMIQAGMQGNQIAAQLEAGLKATGGASGQTAQSLDALSNKIMNMTGIDDDAVKASESMLLTFTNIGKDVFPQATQAVADLATKMANGAVPSAQQMEQASIQLGKALNDPLHGYTALQRVGVSFSEQQKEQIAHFMKVGDVAGAQNVILKEMNHEFGGAAEAAGQANGGFAILSAQIDNMKQSIGQALIPVLTGLMSAITPITGALADALPGAIATVQGYFKQWKPLIDEIWEVLTKLGGTLLKDIQPGLATLGKAFSNLKGPGDIVTNVMQQVANIAHGLQPVIAQVANIFNQLATWFLTTGVPAIKQFADFVQTHVLPTLLQFGGFIATTILPVVADLANWFVTKVVPAAEQIFTWFSAKVLPILEQIATIVVTNVIPALKNIAEQVMTKLVPALENLWNKISPVLIPALQFLGWIISHVVGPALGFIIGVIADVINWVANFIGKIGDLLGWLGNLKDKIGEFVGHALSKVGELKDKFISKLGELKDNAVQKFNDLKDGVMTTLSDLPGKLRDFGADLIQKIIDGIKSMGSNLSGALGDLIHNALASIRLPGGGHLPGFASGGITPGGLFVGAEDGPELLMKPGIYAAPRGSRVYNASDTRDILSGMGGTTYNYNIYPQRAEFDVDELGTTMRRLAWLASTGGS